MQLAHSCPTISWIHLVLCRLIVSSDCWFTSQDCRKHLNVINCNSWLTGGSCYFLAGWWRGLDKPDSAASSGVHLFPKHSISWCRNQPVGYPSCPRPSQSYIFDGALSYLSTSVVPTWPGSVLSSNSIMAKLKKKSIYCDISIFWCIGYHIVTVSIAFLIVLEM